jgi:methionyl-tRNA formyltransferase
LQPDVVVIIAYGQIIPESADRHSASGLDQLHGSLLPKYRGAAPIQWAIVNGETRTGLTTMQIDAGLDTGPMLLKYETEIGSR